MTLAKLRQILKDHGVIFDLAGDEKNGTIRAYCTAHSNDFDKLRITEHGETAINGRIASLKSWLGY